MTQGSAGNTERWDKVRQLFDAAVTLSPAQREACLHDSTHDDAVRDAVRRLLDVHDQCVGSAGVGQAQVAAKLADLFEETELPHDTAIGGFRIVRLLGAGGMGRVYLASRAVGGTTQQVALKIVPLMVRTERTAEQLRRERTLLANLDHPGIARLIDAGELPDDRPYFAMEYVDGVPITHYCDEHRLDLRARLALFRDACDAVAYAHRRLVLHRDLKSGNIFVDAQGRVRLLDFGIGKSIDGAPAAETTAAGFFSLSSAAPEQVLGRATSVATDVYGLGCLLHELLVGAAPFPLRDASHDEIVRKILHEPPALASETVRSAGTAATAWATSRRLGDGAALAAALRGDLDTIVARTLRKEPNDRYRSVDALIADIDNVLDHRPIAARASERWYRFACFVRRHRATAIVAAALGVAAIATTVVSIVQSRRAVAALEVAQLQRDHARGVTDFLIGSFEAADPVKARGRELRADELLASAVKSLEEDAGKQDPALRATIAQTLAHLFFTLDRLPDSVKQAEVAREAAALVPSPSIDLLTRQALADAEAAFVQNRFLDAIRISAEAIERLGDAANVEDGDLLYALWLIRGRANIGAAQPQEAARVLRVAIDTISQRPGTPVERVDNLRQIHASTVSDNGDYEDARKLLENLLHEQRGRGDNDNPVQIQTLRLLAIAHGRLLDTNTAYRYVDEALKRHVALYGEDNSDAAHLLHTLGSLYAGLGRTGEAVMTLRRALEIGNRRIGESSMFAGRNYHRLALIYRFDLHEFGQSEYAFRKALAVLPSESRTNRALSELSLGRLLTVAGRRFEAEYYVADALRILTEIYRRNISIDYAHADLAYLHFRKYDFDRALELLTPAAVAEVRDLPRDDPRERDVVAQMDEMTAFFGL